MPDIIERNQNRITLPQAVMDKAGITDEDMLVVDIKNGVIMLKPQKKPKPTDIMSLFGCASSTYGKTTEEMDAYVALERDSWQK